LRDFPGKINVVKGMVLYLNGKPTNTWLKGRPFGYLPASKHTAFFQAKIIVKMSSLMLMNHKAVLPFTLNPSRRLWGFAKITLFLILF